MVAGTHVQVAHLKQCSSCAREIADSATVCEACSQWAADVAPQSVQADTRVAGAPSARTDTPQRKSGPNRRELVFMLAAVGVSGIITLALLSARGESAGPHGSTGATPGAKTAETVPPVSAGTQTWSADNRAYWVGNRPRSAAFELPAENTVQIWMRSVRPALIVRCMSQTIQVFVVTESAMKIEPQTEDHTVTFGFDGEPAATERWPDSDEHDALFAPDGPAFAQRLMAARTLRVGYTPHNADPVVAHFTVSGLGPLLEPVAKECGWKK
jgi:hypothetical protein